MFKSQNKLIQISKINAICEDFLIEHMFDQTSWNLTVLRLNS